MEVHALTRCLHAMLVEACATVDPGTDSSWADGICEPVAEYPRARRLLMHAPTVTHRRKANPTPATV